MYYTIGGSLMHYRTKGSKNGYSTTPGYKAIGTPAIGRIVNGQYVYDTPMGTNPAARSKTISDTMTRYRNRRTNEAIARAPQKVYGQISKAAQNAYGQASKSVSKLYSQAKIGAANAYATAKNQVDYGMYKAGKLGSQAVSAVKSSAKQVKDWGTKQLDWAGQQASTALASARDFISDLLKKIGAGAKAAQKWAYRKAVRARDAVYNAVRPHYNYLYKPTVEGGTGKQQGSYGVAAISPTLGWMYSKNRKDTKAGKGGGHASRKSIATRD